MAWVVTSKSGCHKGQHWNLSASPFLVGRSLSCDIVINDPLVSRKHCRLYERDSQVYLEDLGSTHPVLVNGEAFCEGALGQGDTITIGSTSLLLTRSNTSGIAASPPPVERISKETMSLFDGGMSLERDALSTSLLEGQPQSVPELVQLFKLGRTLSQAERRETLDEHCTVTLRAALAPESIAIALTARCDSVVRWHPKGSGDDPEFKSLFGRVVREKKALLTHICMKDSGAQPPNLIMAAPLCVGGEAIGAIFLRSTLKNRVYDESDLHMLLSIAQIAAPYYQTLSHVAALKEEVAALDDCVGQGCPLLGKSRAMSKVRGLIRDVARTPLNILLTGETGTGKELAAQMLHNGSERSDGPLIFVNCAAIPAHLFESEMFGHEKGAFTSADKKCRGRFALADGGTLFLDEIGELSAENQARLLRVLESGHFSPVGAERESHADVRIVAATNRDLKRAIQDGRFRRDLYHRICAVEIELPALRQRPSDIPLLAQHFVNDYTTRSNAPRPSLSEDALGYLQELPWSGNVRELRNALERATALSQAATLP
ncbi:MAG: sigma 54-interacting transcriptional regulator, partial [Candidatus Hydrogenedentes bacterium]|nr:sigma 54-interacting transcriptional regulator [Candidatus Hydrogenedentota bacterium]